MLRFRVRLLSVRAYVMIVAKPGTSEDVVNTIRKVKGVVKADSVYGRFDAIVTIEAPDVGALSKVVYDMIEKTPNIVHTETALTL